MIKLTLVSSLILTASIYAYLQIRTLKNKLTHRALTGAQQLSQIVQLRAEVIQLKSQLAALDDAKANEAEAVVKVPKKRSRKK